jgi:DNA-binding transcriptional LysR family regulator
MSDKTVQRLHLTLRQLETFAATANAGSTRAAADRVARSQSAASNALAELEGTLGVQLFDRVGRRLSLNENGRALLPRAAAVLQQAAEIEALFGSAHAAALRLAASFTIGEYLLPDVVSAWKRTHPDSQVRLDIANTQAVLDAVAGLQVDVGFIEAARTHPDLLVHHWRADELVVVASPSHPWAARRVTVRQLSGATWIVREPGSGTREATDRWLVPALGQVTVEMELGSNEAVKRAVASGLGLGCLSNHAVADALAQGWLVKLRTPLPALRRTLSIVVHKSKPLGSAAQDFLKHCMGAASKTPSPSPARGRGSG